MVEVAHEDVPVNRTEHLAPTVGPDLKHQSHHKFEENLPSYSNVEGGWSDNGPHQTKSSARSPNRAIHAAGPGNNEGAAAGHGGFEDGAGAHAGRS